MKGREIIPRLFALIIVVIIAFGMISGSSLFGAGVSRRDSTRGAVVEMAFFYDPDCPCSIKAINEIIPDLEKNYTYLDVIRLDVTLSENKNLAKDFFNAYNIPDQERYDYPFLFAGDHYISYENVDYESGATLIEKYKDIGAALWPDWNVTWSTEIAFFYNSSAPFITSSGQTALTLIQSLDPTHVRHNFFDTYDSLTNSCLLNEFLKAYNSSMSSANAAVFIGNENHSLVDDEIGTETLNEKLLIYAGRNTPIKKVECPPPNGTPVDDAICVLIFYSPTCGTCHQAREFLREMGRKYDQIKIYEFDISNGDNEKKKQSYFNEYKVPKSKWGTLGVFIGDKAYYDVAELKADFEDEIKKYPYGSPCPPEPEPYDVVIDFNIFVIIVAGLIDGVNPCAFVTLMLLVSYLVIRKREKKIILLTGISYTLGVFITYLLLGVGIYKWLNYIEGISTISALMYPITGIIALILGIYSLFDFYKIKKGKGEDTTLKLPKSIKKLTNRIIRKHVKSKKLAGLAFITGAVISALEFMCTGQVYLPTIVYILSKPGFQTEAFFYLVLYNLMFILPLIGVFLAVYFGVTSEKLESIFIKRVGLIKILTAILFFMLAILMFLLSDF
ncbi:MAG: glutaredoxin domain-containing protein [Candidatus Thermoplasmatota archaeon]|nr:glutaredoxin domain-containing protein [Candidatus Thermoplasmatota archaeon]